MKKKHWKVIAGVVASVILPGGIIIPVVALLVTLWKKRGKREDSRI